MLVGLSNSNNETQLFQRDTCQRHTAIGQVCTGKVSGVQFTVKLCSFILDTAISVYFCNTTSAVEDRDETLKLLKDNKDTLLMIAVNHMQELKKKTF